MAVPHVEVATALPVPSLWHRLVLQLPTFVSPTATPPVYPERVVISDTLWPMWVLAVSAVWQLSQSMMIP
jgi:hypothetical protein